MWWDLKFEEKLGKASLIAVILGGSLHLCLQIKWTFYSSATPIQNMGINHRSFHILVT